MTKKITLVFTVVLVLVTVGLMAQSEGRDRDMMRHARFGIFMAESNLFPPQMILRFKDEIGLTAEQATKLEKMQDQIKEASIRQQADIKVLEMKLNSTLKNEQTDRKKLESMIRDMAKLKTDLQIQHMNFMLDVKNLLTPEQIKKIEEFKKMRRHQMMRERDDRRGNRDDRHHPRWQDNPEPPKNEEVH